MDVVVGLGVVIIITMWVSDIIYILKNVFGFFGKVFRRKA